MLKSAFESLPRGAQHALRRWRYARQIERGAFVSPEPEFARLMDYLKPGECAVDVGANVGHYTQRMSEIVGLTGRVIAFEPVPDTFKMLTANVREANVTFLNAAASARSQVLGMGVPNGNAYRAAIGLGEIRVMCVAIDALELPMRVALLKVDAEGHDLEVLKGAERTILRDRPALIVESGDAESWLVARGYRCERMAGSPNLVATSAP